MSACFARCLAYGLAITLMAASPALAQSGADDQTRSDNAQAENQTTSDRGQSSDQPNDSQQSDQPRQQSRDQNAQSRQSGQGDRDRFFNRDGQQDRRADRQDDRQSRREDGRFANRDRQPAIGVTVVERGGMGVRVMNVVPQSPADQAGIEAGDTILEVEGRRVSSAQQLVSLIQEQEAGDTAEFAVIREGREYQVPVRLATREQALPARLRRQDGSQDQSRQFGQSGQTRQSEQSQNWRQGQQDQQRQMGQDQYREQYGQQQGQWGRGSQFETQTYQQGQSHGPPHPPSPYTGAYNQYDSNTQQASYGEQGSQQEWSQGQQRERGQLADRLGDRLAQFEQRLERLAQRLEQIERNGGIRFQAGSNEASRSQTSPSQQTRSDEDQNDDEHEDDGNHGENQ